MMKAYDFDLQFSDHEWTLKTRWQNIPCVPLWLKAGLCMARLEPNLAYAFLPHNDQTQLRGQNAKEDAQRLTASATAPC
jgi:hypothetical protein